MRNETSIKNAKKQHPYAYEAVKNDPEWHAHNSALNGVVKLDRFVRWIDSKIQSAMAAGADGFFFTSEHLQALLSKLQYWQDKYNDVAKQNRRYRSRINSLEFELKLLKEKIPADKPKSKIESYCELYEHGLMSYEEWKEAIDDAFITKTPQERAAEQRKECA